MEMFRSIRRIIYRNLLCFTPTIILVKILLFFVSAQVPSKSTKNTRGRIFVLNKERFRGELEILLQANFEMYTIPFRIQTVLVGLFYDKPWELIAKTPPEKTVRQQKHFEKFLVRLIKPLYQKLDIDLTIGAAVHYKQDYDWGKCSQLLNIPYVVLHRENAVSNSYQAKFLTDRFLNFADFRGSHVIVHNNIMKRIFVESKYIESQHIFVVGPPRMDRYLKKIAAGLPKPKKDRVCLFSFGPGAGLLESSPPHWPKDLNTSPEKYFTELSYQTHNTIINYAKTHPNVEVVIKPKWGGRWLKQIDEILSKHDIDKGNLSNLTVDYKVDAQELISSSDVIIGFASTTLLEAAVAGKWVIVPNFAEANQDKFKNKIAFKEELELFCVISDARQMPAKIDEGLSGYLITNQQMKAREAAFEKYIAPITGDATNKLAECLSKIIASSS